jgi:GxxExxY protein
MDANGCKWELDELAKVVVGAAYAVSNALGSGFLEKVYERALTREIGRRGLSVQCEVAFPIFYLGQSVGDYMADLVVEDQIIVELKCVESFSSEHMAQCINYLKASNLKLALLINFQKPRVEWKRVVHNK